MLTRLLSGALPLAACSVALAKTGPTYCTPEMELRSPQDEEA